MAQERKLSRKELRVERYKGARRQIKLNRSRRKNYKEFAHSRSKHWAQADNFKLEDYMSFN